MWSPEEAIVWLAAKGGTMTFLAWLPGWRVGAQGLTAEALVAPQGPSAHLDSLARATAELRRILHELEAD